MEEGLVCCPVQKNGCSAQLVVLLHAFTMGPEDLAAAGAAVLQVYPDADLLVPRLPAKRFSFADPIQIVTRLAELVSRAWQDRRERSDNAAYERIVLVGHSMGALLARKLYIYACGAQEGMPFEAGVDRQEPLPWAAKVERIVLLAGMNRGWSVSHHMSLLRSLAWTAGIWLGSLLAMVNRHLLIFHIRKGAPFLTNLRLQWLAMRRAAKTRGVGDALTIQLLGTVDDMVGPEDNVDLVTGADFVYLEVPASGHENVIRMDASTAGRQRREAFKQALSTSPEALRRAGVQPGDLTEQPTIREDVTDVIFVIHGIRDLGYWTQKIAWRVKVRGRQAQRVFETETSTYGYFPMLSFLLPWKRQQKVAWLMDQYVEDKACYPNAEFSYLGHSNGTYLLARALKDYPYCRFKHVIFAGSVVRTDYDWSSALQGGRIQAVLNFVASRDLVVAIFPKALQMLGLQDLGSAGHDGFDEAAPAAGPRQVKYVRGGHSAALREENWDALAEFLVSGSYVAPPDELTCSRQAESATLLGRFAPVCWGVLGLAVVFGAGWLANQTSDQWRIASLLLYFGGIYKVVTKF